MENNDRMLKELATPDMVYQPWCIQYPQLEPAQTYELKSGLIHLRGPPQASKGIPCGFLYNEVVGDIGGLHQNESVSVLPRWSSERLAVSSANTFQHLGRHEGTFLEKFFPTSRIASIKKEICGIRQDTGETLHEYWERFNKPCATCPHHQISEQLLIQYFYEGLSMMDRSMIDAWSSTDPLYAFDPEIELTLHRLRKIRNTVVNTSSSSDSAINSNLSSANRLVASSNIFAESGQMENNDRTLKELATPDVVYQPWCIQYPQLEPAQTYELKSGLIHLLPKFH
ncbi:hypothetical protein CR513_17397, partial [Mucuna pruriens]